MYKDNVFNDVFTTVPDTKYFKEIFNKDFVSIEELWGAIEELYFDKEHLEEELEDLKQNIEDNYKPLNNSDITGDLDDDRYPSI